MNKDIKKKIALQFAITNLKNADETFDSGELSITKALSFINEYVKYSENGSEYNISSDTIWHNCIERITDIRDSIAKLHESIGEIITNCELCAYCDNDVIKSPAIEKISEDDTKIQHKTNV